MKLPSAPVVVLLLLGAGFGVSRLQPKLAATLRDTKSRDDVYVLPPPAQLRTMSLGYHAATTDLIWAKLLVEYGVHHQEKRAFPDIEKYIDAILALEKDYAPVFKYADTLVVYRPPRGYEEDARTARRIHERGIAERPHDHDVWLHYGEFLAFVAPSFLSNEDEITQWRKEGASALEKAVNLGADTQRAVTAASLLSRYGERDAEIRQLRNAYALTDVPAEREKFAQRLEALEASQANEDVERTFHAIEGQWRREMPFLKRGMYLLIGPLVDARYCAGPPSADEKPQCARQWDEVIPASRP